MGKWKEVQAPNKQEPTEVRCIYKVRVPFLIRKVEREAWQHYVETLPTSYEVEVKREWETANVLLVEMTYENASANTHDIMRRLRGADGGLQFTCLPGSRERVCGCPAKTTRCRKRVNS